jgi:Tfp pilus assembly protein PilE
MARGVGLLSLVVALAAAAYLMSGQLSTTTSQKSANAEITKARQTAAGVKLEQGAFAIEQFHALNGTYAATTLGHLGVKLVRADASSYCLQAGNEHLAGPGGSPAAGPC